MKLFARCVLGMAVLPLGLAVKAMGDALPPGQVDFGNFAAPSAGGQFVEVNVTSSLISLATKFIEKDQPDIAKVLRGLQLVHVNVVGVDDQNRSDVQERIQSVRKELESKGWERIVKVVEKDQDVGVYLKSQNKDTVQGLVVVVLDGSKQAVFVNVVGDIKPEQLSMLGETLHIDPLKKLGHRVEKTEPEPEKP
ncbi:MAG TPA: DUF4252 domain-containing protein [Verrucomicrobiae bacterium]|nr:DUF4252 domain-containing protein [Verrucomicrobiae bacterium]